MNKEQIEAIHPPKSTHASIEEDLPRTQEMPVLPAAGITRDEAQMRIGRMEAQLMQWGAELDEISAKAATTVKADYHENLDELKLKYYAARVKLNELKAASSEKWDDFKIGIESAWLDLEAAFKKLTS